VAEVVECLFKNKHEALGSNSNSAREREREREPDGVIHAVILATWEADIRRIQVQG
jgi:hypothetical protein